VTASPAATPDPTAGESASPWQQADLFGAPSALPSPAATPPAAPRPAQHAPSSPSLPPLQPATQPQAAPGRSGIPATLLILDTETTALSPEQGQCIEVGAILFQVAERAVLAQVSFLLPAASNPAAHVNGIDAAITRLPQPWQAGLQCFEAMLAAADALLAHNAAFDRQWFGHGLLPAVAKPWICSMEDIRWPAESHLRASPSVRDLALAYGVPVWAAHRALTDCIYLAQVFERCSDLELLLEQGREPRRLYRARLSYEERHKAREAGFRWNEPVSGAWSRKLSDREAALLPFAVVPVDEAMQRRSA
jgi:DNA polymerase-3 subunit epsilon